jgi:hypothetical protein
VSSWQAWPLAMVPVAAIGLLLSYRLRNAVVRPAAVSPAAAAAK